MNIHIYLSPTSPAVREIPQLKSVIRDRYLDALLTVTVDDGLPEDCCFIEGCCDELEIQEIYSLLGLFAVHDAQQALAVA